MKPRLGIRLIIMEGLKWAAAALLLVLMVSQLMGNRISKASFDTVKEASLTYADQDMMKEGSVQMIKRLYGLGADQFDGIALYYPMSNMGSEEILVVKLKDVSQQEQVKGAIDARLATQKKNFNGYGTYQLGMLNKSITEVRGNYILFISGTDPNKVDQAFLKAL